MARLAEQFVCVRMQSMNGVNINLFQFEYDLTWMAFFMDDKDRFYARYGGREDTGPETHLTKESLLRVMRQVLDLHKTCLVQTSRYEPTGKPVRIPEDIPPMKAMLAKRKENKCIHCHDVKVTELRHLQSLEKFTRDLVFTYPAPSALGLDIDPNAQNRVRSVAAGSLAEQAGLRSGDALQSVDDQRVLTLADLTRVLELTAKDAKLPVEAERSGQRTKLTLALSGDWKRTKDPSWRESLHVAGPSAGLWGMKLDANERRKLGISPEAMAVKVTFIWGDYTRKAGIRNGDVIIELDGVRKDLTIHQLHAHLHLHRNYGETIRVVVNRNGKEEALMMKLPDRPESE